MAAITNIRSRCTKIKEPLSCQADVIRLLRCIEIVLEKVKSLYLKHKPITLELFRCLSSQDDADLDKSEEAAGLEYPYIRVYAASAIKTFPSTKTSGPR